MSRNIMFKIPDNDIMDVKKLVFRIVLSIFALLFTAQVYFVPDTFDISSFIFMSIVLIGLTLASVTSLGFNWFKSYTED